MFVSDGCKKIKNALNNKSGPYTFCCVMIFCNVLSNSHCDICSVFSLFYVTKLTFTSVYVSSARCKHLFPFDVCPMQLIVMAQQHILERLRQLPILFLLRIGVGGHLVMFQSGFTFSANWLMGKSVY